MNERFEKKNKKFHTNLPSGKVTGGFAVFETERKK